MEDRPLFTKCKWLFMEKDDVLQLLEQAQQDPGERAGMKKPSCALHLQKFPSEMQRQSL